MADSLCLGLTGVIAQAIRTLIESEPGAKGAAARIHNASIMMNQLREISFISNATGIQQTFPTAADYRCAA